MTSSDGFAPSGLESLRRSWEPLWIGALGIHFILLGKEFVPKLIHLLGRAGQPETVEWAVYMSLLVGYGPAIWIIARVLPRFAARRWVSSVRFTIVVAALVELGLYLMLGNWTFILGAAIAAVVTVVALGYAEQSDGPSGRNRSRFRMLPLLLAAAFSWMCAGALVSWRDALSWIFGSPSSGVSLISALALTAFALRRFGDASLRENRLEVPDYAALTLLTVFSFRTYPVVEFFHWGFYIGPIEQLRQGGRLLWDTPSQYGFASILIPAWFPASSWISFWIYQSAIFAVVAGYMYVAVRRLGSRWAGALFSFAVTFTTLFFRPRDDTLILPAQMTPSGGPVRFLWSFVLLAFVAGYNIRPATDRQSRGFVVGGTAIWLASVLWSAEGAIYCSAIWFSSLAVFLAQRVTAWRETGKSERDVLRHVTEFVSVPVVAFVVSVVLVVLGYLLLFHASPDWRAYIDYVVLYSRGGFGALPVDPSGSVWYLMLLFLIISTVGGMYLAHDARDPRLVTLAGLWAGAWSIGSYFVGRSHPVNALSITPVLLFALAITVRLLRMDDARRWHRLVVVSIVPAFGMPVALTLGHAKFPEQIQEPQLSVSRFTEQLPIMNASLVAALNSAGARPSDSFVLVGDGRLMLPAWPVATKGGRLTSERSWLPKPYEIIGSLSSERRQLFIDRNAQRFPEPGWLIQSKRDTINRYSEHRAQIESVRHEVRRFENRDWIISWMVVHPAPPNRP